MDEILNLIYNCTKEEFSVLLDKLGETGIGVDNKIKLSEQRFGARYIRTITVPKDFVLVGQQHKQVSAWTMLYGEMHTRTESDDFARLVTDTGAGWNKVNDRRIGVTAKETKWATLHTIPVGVPKGSEMDWVLGYESVEA